MTKLTTAIIVVLVAIAAALAGYAAYKSFMPVTPAATTPTSQTPVPSIPSTPQPSAAESGCTGSGGTVSTSSCCQSASDFPNSCAIGACGCAPANSHEVKTCACPAGMCFSGTACVQQESMITIYCSNNGCAAQQVNAGAGTLVQGCYRNLSDCQTAIPPKTTRTGCQNDSDCAPATCCHATACINGKYKSVCDVFCTQECSGPLDCGAGSCKCVSGNCAVVPSLGAY